MVKELSTDELGDLIETIGALSNPKRVKILKFISNNPGKRLIEIHEGTKNKTGISHRETTYNYITPLVEAGLVKKNRGGNNVTYSIRHKEIVIEL